VKSTRRDLAGTPPIVFSRDRKTSEQVWSGEIGYPGEPRYLEFHKKHHNSGLRYWAVTDPKADLGTKRIYDPAAAHDKISQHAFHFVSLVKDTLREHKERKGTEGIVCSPFDTELFGHWWFEGPRFIGKVFELLVDEPNVRLTNCSEYLSERTAPIEVIALPEGSWGEGGGHYVWSNHNVAWTWDHIYPAEERFAELLKKYRASKANVFLERVMKQAARELLLLESSDWQFIITTGGAPEYAKERFSEHVRQFNLVADLAERTISGTEPDEHDKELLVNLENIDRVFSEIDLDWWR
jgi:1,4-alpha-glucan branching enzyme